MAARKVRREALLKAYRHLDATEPQRISLLLEHSVIDQEQYTNLLKLRTEAFTELVLFGDEFLAGQADRMLMAGDHYDTSLLMNGLRDRLRSEYGLEPIMTKYKWLEIRATNRSGTSDS